MSEDQRSGLGNKIVDRMRDFTERLRRGEPIEVIRVTRQETPDGPMHTFEKAKLLAIQPPKDALRTIIAGSRDRVKYSDICRAVELCGWVPTVVISGKARGADEFGERYAREHSIPIEEYPADWEQFGKSAGPRRNAQMAEVAEALIAVWDGESRGTKNMIETARAKGLRVYVHGVAGHTEVQ